MRINTAEIKGNIRAQSFLGCAIILFLYKLFFYSSGSFVLSLINEILVGLTVVTLILYLTEVISARKQNPLSMVMNIGILNAVIFFMIMFSNSILSGFKNFNENSIANPNLIDTIISFFYSFVIIGAVSYIFLVYKELFYLKQKKNVNTFFNTMIIFFVLASFTTVLNRMPELSYIKETFFIISILLIIINSVRISWMAFIIKKEKIILLVISVFISILFVVNLANNGNGNAHSHALVQFSSSLNQFLKILMIYGVIYFTVLFFTTLFHLPTAEAFDRKAQEVNFLQYFSKLITESMDFDELAETVTDMAVKVCNAHASWIVWKEGEEFKSIANKNIGYLDSNVITKFLIQNIQKRNPAGTFLLNLKKLEDRSKLGEEFFTIAAAPLKSHNEIKGYLVAAKKNDFVFDDEDTNAMDTFSDYASLAIENSKLLEESIEKERMEKELDVAREIQRKILPIESPVYNNLCISSTFIPAFEVGGDYYDYFDVGENKFGFVIADVSGKGISAAFIMAEVKGIFESLTKIIESPKEILIKANEILKRTLDRHNFVSAAYGLIDLNEGILRIARAGHCPIVFLRNNTVENIRPSGIGLGLNFGNRFTDNLEEVKINLQDNDVIVLYTDGITEAKNSDLEDFGSSYFERILLENCSKEVDHIAKKVISEVTLYSQNISQHDDITLVILKWKKKLKIDGEKEWLNSAPQQEK